VYDYIRSSETVAPHSFVSKFLRLLRAVGDLYGDLSVLSKQVNLAVVPKIEANLTLRTLRA
jgi:hypothetical protein